MDRRTFLKTTTAAAGSSLAVSAVAGQAVAATPEITAPALNTGMAELAFSTPWTADEPVRGDAAGRLVARLKQTLGDRYFIRQVDDAAEADLTFALHDADADLGFAFFGGLPGSFGLDPAFLQAWIAVGGGQILWDDLAAQHGWKPLLAGHTGARPGLWASRSLADIRDLEGGSVVLAAGTPLARLLGVRDAAPTSASDIFQRLGDGHLTAVEWGNPLTGLVAGWAQTARYFYRGGIHRHGRSSILNVRLSLWERLQHSERLALEGLAAHELSLALAEAIAHERLAAEALARSETLGIHDLPSALTADLNRVAAAYVEEAGAASRSAAHIRDSYLAFRAQISEPELPFPTA